MNLKTLLVVVALIAGLMVGYEYVDKNDMELVILESGDRCDIVKVKSVYGNIQAYLDCDDGNQSWSVSIPGNYQVAGLNTDSIPDDAKVIDLINISREAGIELPEKYPSESKAASLDFDWENVENANSYQSYSMIGARNEILGRQMKRLSDELLAQAGENLNSTIAMVEQQKKRLFDFTPSDNASDKEIALLDEWRKTRFKLEEIQEKVKAERASYETN